MPFRCWRECRSIIARAAGKAAFPLWERVARIEDARRESNCAEVDAAIGRAQGWRRAPPPSAGGGPCPPPPVGLVGFHAQGRGPSAACWLGHRVAGGIPFLPSCDHGVEDDNQLAHAGNERHLRLFSLGNQALIEGFDDGIVLGGGAEARHVDGVANPAATTLDVALATALSAIVVIRSKADQGRGDLVAYMAKLRHSGDEVSGGRFSEARYALDDLGAFGKICCGLDLGRDCSLELFNFGSQALQDACMRFSNLSRRRMCVLALQPGLDLDQGYACFHQRHQFLVCGIARLAWGLVKRLRKPGDHLRVDRIVLGQPPGRQRKAADPLGVDNPDLDASVVQHFAPFTLVTAACLHHRLAHLVLAEPGNQLAVTLCGVRAALPQCKCANARIHLALGDIDADDNEIVLCHHPLPSLLGSGSKPLQLFGLRKTPELSLALTQAYRFWGVTGSVPATGGFAETARSHILPDFLDTRGVGRRHERWNRMRWTRLRCRALFC